MQLVLCTCPASAAMDMARAVMDARVVAYADIVSGAQRISRVGPGDEVSVQETAVLLMHTVEEKLGDLVKTLVAAGPMDTPPIIALSVYEGATDFMRRIEDEWTDTDVSEMLQIGKG